MYTTLITTDQLSEILADPSLVIIDCRFSLSNSSLGRRQYQSDHLPHAHYADLNLDLSAKTTLTTGRHPLPAPQDFQRLLSGWGVSPQHQVVVYDAEGGAMAASRLWWLLKLYGCTAAAVLDGGYSAWKSEGRPTTQRIPALQHEHGFTGRMNSTMYLTMPQMEVFYRDPDRLVMDARTAGRYAGLEETIDLVAGHIPGAINLPYTTLIGPDGKLLPAEKIRAIFKEKAGNTPPENITVYCGSGVTSALILLAMESAGIHRIKLYPGSWSEWIRSSHHQIAVRPGHSHLSCRE